MNDLAHNLPPPPPAASISPESAEQQSPQFHSPQEPYTQVYQLSYEGNIEGIGREVGFGVMWTLGTWGLFMPWLMARIQRYIASNTTFYGVPIQYYGTGSEILQTTVLRWGFLVAWLGSAYLVGGISSLLQASTLILGAVVALFIYPFGFYARLSLIFSKIRWGRYALRLDFGAKAFVLHSVHQVALLALSLGCSLPWLICSTYAFILQRASLGPYRFLFKGSGRNLILTHALWCLFFIPTAGINSFWYLAEIGRYLVSNTWFGAEKHGALQGHLDLSGGDLFGLFLLNAICLLGSFGLAIPWLLHFNYTFLVKRFRFHGQIDLRTVVDDAIGI